MKKETTQTRLDNAVTRIFQLENDLAAAKRREEIMRKELDLARQSSQLSGNLLVQVTAERDDWKNAFKTISRLVK